MITKGLNAYIKVKSFSNLKYPHDCLNPKHYSLPLLSRSEPL